ncbi:MAG: suppressor of fused domain protein [Sedimentisphaerales bacterium]|nr:suppressor of fused domain protein [Sedimentisphaerales bacterium]
MFDFLKKLFGKKKNEPEFTDEEYDKHYEAKCQALEKILGPQYEYVGHAIIPFQIGGTVDMYYFPNAIEGTGFATMELIEPDGSGPRPGRIGTYELVAFTRHPIAKDVVKYEEPTPFNKIERRLCSLFTAIGNYSYDVVLNPRDTCEFPPDDGKESPCLVFDEYKKEGVDFTINGKKHGLLLCIEVFRCEMEYARKNGTAALLTLLKEKDYYPYSDLDREPVVDNS